MVDQIKQQEKEFFDQFDREGGYERFKEESYEKIFSFFRKAIQPQKGDVLVDMGCGTGAFTARLKAAYPDVEMIGMDISEGSIDRANQLYSGIKFIAGDVEATSLDDNSVDIICYFGLLHHFPDFSKVAREAHRILKKGGRFFSFDPHNNNPVFWLYRNKKSPLYSPVGVTQNERLLTKKELREVFSPVGFDVSAQTISGLKFSYIESNLMKKLLWAYNLWDVGLSLTPLERLMGAWVIGWGKKV